MKNTIVFMLVICTAACAAAPDDDDGPASALNIGFIVGPINRGLSSALQDITKLFNKQKNLQSPVEFKNRFLDAMNKIVKGLLKTIDKLFPGLFEKIYPVYKKVSDSARSTLDPVAKGLEPVVTPLVRGQLLNQGKKQVDAEEQGDDNGDEKSEDNGDDGDE